MSAAAIPHDASRPQRPHRRPQPVSPKQAHRPSLRHRPPQPISPAQTPSLRHRPPPHQLVVESAVLIGRFDYQPGCGGPRRQSPIDRRTP